MEITMELEEMELSELRTDDMKELNGGGWISDFVEWWVYETKCTCARPSQMSGAMSL